MVVIDRSEPEPPRRFTIFRKPDSLRLSQIKPVGTTAAEDSALAIATWENPVESWAMTLCGPVLALAAMGTGVLINRHFRDILVLTHTARVSTYVVALLFPGMTTAITHQFRVSDRIYGNLEKCPVCTQVKAAVWQLTTGVLYPAIIVPAACLPVASRYQSYSLPKITKEKPFRIFGYVKEVYKPIQTKLMYIAAFQILLSMGVAAFEQHMYYAKILPKVREAKRVQQNISNISENQDSETMYE